MKKSEVISKVDPKKTYLGSYVVARINDVSCEDLYVPKYLKFGDVIVVASGIKKRPSVIVKVLEDYVISIPLTSIKNHHYLIDSKSRFLNDGFFCNSYVVTDNEVARKEFIGVYDNDKLLNEAVNNLGVFFMKMFMGVDFESANKHSEKDKQDSFIFSPSINKKHGIKQKFLFRINGINYKASDVVVKYKISRSYLSMAFKNTNINIVKGIKIERLEI